VVFVGKVVFTDDDGSGTFAQKTLVHFEVEEGYKGLDAEVRDVWIDPGSCTSCYADYRLGERYLVFGYRGALLHPPDSSAVTLTQRCKSKALPAGIDPKNPPVVYVAPECSGTRQITEKSASRDVEYLRKLKAKMQKRASPG
jgi:hypothetical protein